MSPAIQRTNSSLSPARKNDSQRSADAAHGRCVRGESASASTTQAVDAMWNEIEQYRRELKTEYVDDAVVTPNHTGVRCPNNDKTLTVQLDKASDERTPMHANLVQLSKCYAVGQSPGGDFKHACTRDLIQSLDSGRGLFQFTSRNAHQVLPDSDHGNGNDSDSDSPFSTVAQLLFKQMSISAGKVTLGNRYEIDTFLPAPEDPPQTDVTRYQLTARDLKTNELRTVYLTQAGLRFVDKLLRPEQIARAAELLRTHPSSNPPAVKTDAHPQTAPLICSAAGIGRSAALVVYADLCSGIPHTVNKNTLDDELTTAIKKGIDARGPKFLHSKNQLAALREALLIKMQAVPHSPTGDKAARQHLMNALQQEFVRRNTAEANKVSDTISPAPAPQQEPQPDHPSPTPQGPLPQPKSGLEPSPAPVERAMLQDAAPAALPSPVSVVAPLALTATTADIGTLPVQGIICKDTGQLITQFVLPPQGHAAARKPVGAFVPVGAEERATLPSSSTITHALKTAWQSPRGSVPDRLRSNYERALRLADEQKLPSVGFASDLVAVDVEKASAVGEPAPIARAAALAIATAARYAADAATSVQSVVFHCANDVQKKVYDDLIGRMDALTQLRVFEALRRPKIKHLSTPTASAEFFEEGQLATYVPPKINASVNNCAEIITPQHAPHGTLNGVPFAEWEDPPTTAQGWNDAAAGVDEPARPSDLRAAGAVIVERDGRVWVVAPANQHAKLINTFPKGQIEEKGLTAAGCALEEAYEESGLRIRLTEHLIDTTSRFGTTRYYLAERIGGTPADVGWESQAVSLVPQDKLHEMFTDERGCNHRRDRLVMNAMLARSAMHADPAPAIGALRSQPHASSTPDFSALMRELNNNEHVQKSINDLSKNIQHAMSCRSDPPRFEWSDQSFSEGFGTRLSKQINRIVKPWRTQNCELIKNDTKTNPPTINVIERTGSVAPHAQTMLRSAGENAAPFLHANHIPLNTSISFIAAQRPRTFAPPHTDNSDNFWQTVLKEQVALIVDLTEAEEKLKETAYGPTDKGHKEIRDHTVHLISDEKVMPSLRAENIVAFNVPNRRRTELKRLHFTGWKDKTAIDVDTLIALGEQVVQASGNPPGKVLVHCSHGVGRTGTLITYLAASEQLGKLLHEKGGNGCLSVQDFIQVVMTILVRGRIERGSQFVSEKQLPLVLAALLTKHFDRADGDVLIAKDADRNPR